MPKPTKKKPDTMTANTTMFGTAEAVAHHDMTFMDSKIAAMTRDELEKFVKCEDNAVPVEMYLTFDGEKYVKTVGVHRAFIALQFLNGEIKPEGVSDCPYAKQVGASAIYARKHDKTIHRNKTL
jgi:hypothetical protein